MDGRAHRKDGVVGNRILVLRLRKIAQDGPGYRIKPVHWNDVSQKRLPCTRSVVVGGGVIELAGRIGTYPIDETGLTKLRKIAAAHLVRRVGIKICTRGARRIYLKIGEEKQLVFLRKHARDVHRTADGEAQGREPVNRFLKARLVHKVIGGIEHLVPLVPVPSAMQFTGAGLGDHIDVGARRNTELGVCNVRLDVKLLNGIWGGADSPDVGENRVIEYAVQGEVVLLAPVPVYGRAEAATTDGNGE